MKALRSPTARAVATVLAKARVNAGLTQRQLAVPELITLAEAMDVDPVDLIKRILRDRGGK